MLRSHRNSQFSNSSQYHYFLDCLDNGQCLRIDCYILLNIHLNRKYTFLKVIILFAWADQRIFCDVYTILHNRIVTEAVVLYTNSVI